MNWILIKLLEYKVRQLKEKHVILILNGDTIIAKAYGNMIKNCEDTIMFLESESNK